MKERVLLGMSGGTDSSVAAMLLLEEGYEVIAVTFLFSEFTEKNDINILESQQLCKDLGIEHCFADLKKPFEELVVQYFIHEYIAGKTPFPCAVCNPNIKFKFLERFAKVNNCRYISTGHYARTGQFNGINFIFTGIDPDKDQSFFLWGLKSELIGKLLFPLGNLRKTQVRMIAAQKGFSKISERKDSLGICFIEGNDYREFLISKGFLAKSGNFVNENGEILGTHTGITNYTIGQRKGLITNVNIPLFVSEIRPKTNEIVLSSFDKLYRSKLVVRNIFFNDFEEIQPDKIFTVKVRYRLQNTPCKLHINSVNKVDVKLLEPLAMIASGQTAVFYDGKRVVGGGFIESSM